MCQSQATFKVLNNYQINPKLVWDCHQFLAKLAEHNTVQVIWVPGRRGTEGNETAGQFARLGSEHPFIGPEPACSISAGAAKRAVRDLFIYFVSIDHYT
jgi:ribonuclease HI